MMPEVEPFVLELVENPHPAMLAGALRRRAAATRPMPTTSVGIARWERDRDLWSGYLAAMCDATGETPEAITAWLDRMEAKA